ncbi:MAG: flagella cluster protein [Haloarculaceae archaeon]
MDDVADDERIDVHEYRHGLKLLSETRETARYRNEEGYDCPACGRPFRGLFVTEKRHSTFSPEDARPFCVRREDDRIVLFTH